MKIIEKIKNRQAAPHSCRQPVIAFLGDSVTQGCFEIYNDHGRVETTFFPEEAYAAKVRHILSLLYPSASVNIINAGISGDTSWGGLDRLERDVLSLNPDLVVVCYGLNDAGCGESGLERYADSLGEIFAKIKASGAEAIFLTPNLRSDDTDYMNPDKLLEGCVRGIAANERDGWLQKYLESARQIAKAADIPVCDCNALWLKLKAGGVNTNALLANDVNHPTRELHWMFAYELVRTMFE